MDVWAAIRDQLQSSALCLIEGRAEVFLADRHTCVIISACQLSSRLSVSCCKTSTEPGYRDERTEIWTEEKLEVRGEREEEAALLLPRWTWFTVCFFTLSPSISAVGWMSPRTLRLRLLPSKSIETSHILQTENYFMNINIFCIVLMRNNLHFHPNSH